MTKKVVVLGDMVKSAKTKERDELQKHLIYVCKIINKNFSPEIYAPFKITRGDEVAGVLNKPEKSYKIIFTFRDLLFPYSIRFVVVYGELTAGLETKDVSIIDGPAFTIANDKLQESKRKDHFILFLLYENYLDRTMTILSDLSHWIRMGWTLRQRKAIELYLKLGTQEKVARKLGITQQNVAKLLKSANFEKVKEAEEILEELLIQIQPKWVVK
ncbi:MAG: SatD family protein [Nitrospirota bacterium]|nr:SatD family protein [candidate division WOR-3 bacterium]MDH5769494.1 SatD family protein [Nitrospirota bacterium]